MTAAALVCLGAAFGSQAGAQQKANQRTPPQRPEPPAAAPTPAGRGTAAGRPLKPEPPTEEAGEAAISYAYEFTQPQFNPHLIRIEHDAAGRGNLTFERRDDAAPLVEPLEISPLALARIKAAWDELKFLDSTESYQDEKQFPHLGTMRLRMTQATRNRTAEFNWTHNPHASALIREYRRLGDQQLFVFEIALARLYQPSDAVKLVKRLEHLLDRDGLSDAAQMLPLLRDLSTDERIPLIARNQVGKLLGKIENKK